MTPRLRVGGRWRGIPLAALLLTLAFLAAGVFVIFQYDTIYRAQRKAEAQVQADILAASVTAALDFGDHAAARESLNALKVNRQVLGAAVYDRTGALFEGFARGGALLAPRYGPGAVRSADGFSVTAPIVRAGTGIGEIGLTTVGDPLSRRATRYSLLALLVALAAVVVGVLGAAQAALRRTNRQLADANEELRVQIEQRTKAEDALRQAQKMQALGQLTGGIAHDFNNLLTVIGGSADLLKRADVPDDKRIRFATAIAQTAERAAALTSQLLAFARRQPLRPQVLDLNAQVRGMADLLERSIGGTVEISLELAGDLCRVKVDPTQLEVAILNIAVNARDAMPGGGRITLRTAMATFGEGGDRAVSLSIADTGEGIPPEVLDRVFEPFFTTKSVGKGTGLGLSQVYGFIAQSGGDVRATSVRGQGTTIAMLLPCTDDQPDAAAAGTANAEGGRGATVLLVEDNEQVGAFAETLLGELGHKVVRARSGEEALGIIDRGAAFDVVFSDIVMPGMSGIELAERIAERRAGLPIILTSGYSDQLSDTGAGGRTVLSKPYRLDTLAAALAKALSA